MWCRCGHDEGRHHPSGRCTVVLPAFEEEELPTWHCPCHTFAPVDLAGRLFSG